MSELDEMRLDAFVEEYGEDKPELSSTMSLEIINEEGGGNSVPDESERYSRLEWLEETDGGHSEKVWSRLAAQEVRSETVDDNEEIVYAKIPGWYIEDEDNKEWSRSFGKVYGEFTGFLKIRTDLLEDSDAWPICKICRGSWTTPRNDYGLLWLPKSLGTIYRKDGESNYIDEEEINRRDGLRDEIDILNADDDDYDWRLAIGAAYRRATDIEDYPLQKAQKKCDDLPKSHRNRVEKGMVEYVKQKEADRDEIDSNELAKVMNALIKACEP